MEDMYTSWCGSHRDSDSGNSVRADFECEGDALWHRLSSNDEFIKFVHGEYIKQLQTLFEANKCYMGYPNRTLEIY